MVYWWLLFTGSLHWDFKQGCSAYSSPVLRSRLAQALLPRKAPFWICTYMLIGTSYQLPLITWDNMKCITTREWHLTAERSSSLATPNAVYSFATTSPDYKKKTHKPWKFGTPKTLMMSFTPCSSPQRFNASY